MSLVAQDIEDCLAIVDQAIRNAATVCSEMDVNQACLASPGVNAEFTSDTDVRFEEIGDVVDLASLSSLQLAPMDESAEDWGFVVIHVNADLPDDSDQYATILAYGDVNISELSPTMDTFNFSNATDDSPCDGAPASGMLIDTPDDSGTVTFRINDRFELAFNSTGTVSYDADDLIFSLFVMLGEVQARAMDGEDVSGEVEEILVDAFVAGQMAIFNDAAIEIDEDADLPEGLDRLAGALDEETHDEIVDSILTMLDDADLSALDDTYYFNAVATGAEGINRGDAVTLAECQFFETFLTGQLTRNDNGIAMTITGTEDSSVFDLTPDDDASFTYFETYEYGTNEFRVYVGAPPRLEWRIIEDNTDVTCYFDLVEVSESG